MALVKKSAQQEISVDQQAALQAISLSPTQRVLANITTVPVERRRMSKEISAVGVVDVAEPSLATVSARFRGRIERLHINATGVAIRKGEPLFDLYSPDLLTAQREYLVALSQLRAAQDRADVPSSQMQESLLRGVRDRLMIHFGMTEQQIKELEASQEIRSTLTFISPLTGTVLEKLVQEGQYVDEGSPLYRLANLSVVWVYLDVYEQDLRYIQRGQQVTIRTSAYPAELFRGRITFVDPMLGSETRTIRVRTEFPNPHGKLKPNMFVDASVRVDIGSVKVVPASAVLAMGKRNVVWVEVKENTFEPRAVLLGARSDSFYEIVSGVEVGEHVASTGGYLIDSESLLQSPTTRDPHAGHSSTKTTNEPRAPESSKTDAIVSDVPHREIEILVKGRYKPDVIRVKKGERVHLKFFRDEDSDCTNEVVFDDFNIRRRLPARKLTTIELTPTRTGEFKFTCGMAMVHGTFIVE
jgi:Cu(I)/Ag(I) efflux system membrane fusion protein